MATQHNLSGGGTPASTISEELHGITAAAQQQSRRRVIEEAASSLRDQLAALEQQMHEAA